MNNATKRSILRWVHLLFSIPVLGYIYGPAADVQQYAGAVRLFFMPAIVFAGYWMYSGVVFAVVGVAVWLGAYALSGSGGIILGQVALFITYKIWRAVRARSRPVERL